MKGLIQASKLKDNSLFWRLIRLSFKGELPIPDCHITPLRWEEHFKSLYQPVDVTNVAPSIDLTSILPWAPVTELEIRNLVDQLKCGKAPGKDLIPPEAIKSNLKWWAPILASLFTYIDQTGQIPEDWNTAIVVPIYKKGPKDDPSCYRPISLLSIISKIYARHLYDKLKDWMEQEQVLADEQAGFRHGRSTIDQCLVLQHLVGKYKKLYVAFVDLKAAFDLVPRDKLWEKFMDSNIDKRLLALIMSLHKNTSLQVRCTPQGHLSNTIPTQRGVRQGCILAPLLFNFYINSLVEHLTKPEFHPPKIAHRHLSLLLYADDAALISRTPVGLRRALQALATCCQENRLEINYDKTKVMAFGERSVTRVWRIYEHRIEQVAQFKYLGVIFQNNNSKSAHGAYLALNAQKSATAIIQYIKTKGGNSIPAALKLFHAKVLAQLLYGSQLGPFTNINVLERVQSKFLRAILGVPRDVSNAKIRLETGQIKVEARIWINILSFWLRLLFNSEGIVALILKDDVHNGWLKNIQKKLAQLGLSMCDLPLLGLERARLVIKQRI